MIWEFVGTLMVAVAAAGVTHMLVRATRGRLPGWLVPASAGAAMLVFVIYMEYSWAGRIEAQLPEEATVASRNQATAWFRPWTYIVPYTSRMTVVDHRFERTNEAFPGMVITRLVLLGRWEPGRPVDVIFDCDVGRRADLRDTVHFADDGTIEGADWWRLPEGDPLLRAVCEGAGAMRS